MDALSEKVENDTVGLIMPNHRGTDNHFIKPYCLTVLNLQILSLDCPCN